MEGVGKYNSFKNSLQCFWVTTKANAGGSDWCYCSKHKAVLPSKQGSLECQESRKGRICNFSPWFTIYKLKSQF